MCTICKRGFSKETNFITNEKKWNYSNFSHLFCVIIITGDRYGIIKILRDTSARTPN